MTEYLVPLAASFFISLICSPAGISGAFLLLPFQVTFMGNASPGVSGTNHIFNILACPSGVWRFYKDGRLLVPLTWHIIAGTLPGVVVGAWCRLTYMSAPARFQLFAAVVLAYISWRLSRQLKGGREARGEGTQRSSSLKVLSNTLSGLVFQFNGSVYTVAVFRLFFICFFVGLAGGVYGVGGGAILTPFLTVLLHLPIHAISGACLFATFWTSIAGFASFWLFAWMLEVQHAMPNLELGLIFGLGGIAGMYLGASAQKYLSGRFIRLSLACLMGAVSCHYFWVGFRTLF